MTSEMVAAVAETPAEITGIPSVPAALVLNSGACDLVVDNGPDASLNPQSGCRLKAGELMTFPARDGRSLQLYAVAAGPGGQVTEVIFPDDGGACPVSAVGGRDSRPHRTELVGTRTRDLGRV